MERVVFLLPRAASSRDYERFGVSILLAEGLRVELWNVGPLVLPHDVPATDATFPHVLVRHIATYSGLQWELALLGAQDVLVLLYGPYVGQVRASRRLLALASATPALLVTLAATQLPDVPFAEYAKRARTFRETLRCGWLGLSMAKRLLIRRIGRAPVLGFATRGLAKRIWGVRPLDEIWAGASARGVSSYLVGPATSILYVHTLDYDLVRQVKPSEEASTSTAVVIDSMGPLHPDIEALQFEAYSDEAAAYFAELNGILERIELAIGSKVIVAAHPRARPGSLEARYGDREVVYGATIAAIARSSFVLFPYPSTAVGAAVALRKPVVFLRLSSFVESVDVLMATLAKQLGVQVLVADPGTISPSTDIDETRYQRYFEEYVKRPGTPQGPFWFAVARKLMQPSGT